MAEMTLWELDQTDTTIDSTRVWSGTWYYNGAAADYTVPKRHFEAITSQTYNVVITHAALYVRNPALGGADPIWIGGPSAGSGGMDVHLRLSTPQSDLDRYLDRWAGIRVISPTNDTLYKLQPTLVTNCTIQLSLAGYYIPASVDGLPLPTPTLVTLDDYKSLRRVI